MARSLHSLQRARLERVKRTSGNTDKQDRQTLADKQTDGQTNRHRQAEGPTDGRCSSKLLCTTPALRRSDTGRNGGHHEEVPHRKHAFTGEGFHMYMMTLALLRIYTSRAPKTKNSCTNAPSQPTVRTSWSSQWPELNSGRRSAGKYPFKDAKLKSQSSAAFFLS